MTLITTTITAMPAVLDANLDDTALFAVDDKNRNTRHATMVQVRARILHDVLIELAAIEADILVIDDILASLQSQINAI